jgi:hypothetical protein
MSMIETAGRRAARRTPILAPILALVLAACTGAASVPSSSGGPSLEATASPASPAPSGSDLAPLKEALLARFGPLAYCDPDFFPVARNDEASAAQEHLSQMRTEQATWAAISHAVGFDPSSTPTGDTLLAAYRNWKMLRAIELQPAGSGSYRFDATFHGASPSAASSEAALTHVTGTVASDGSIAVESQEPGKPPLCPICLARGTRIAIPGGDAAVETLRPGETVWSVDANGRRIPVVIIEVGSTPVPPTHELVRLVLADGREVDASPGHPLADGRSIGSLQPGDAVDGSTVVSADRVPDSDGRTFDVLPAGPTGAYWADGILLGSTLSLDARG